MSAHLTDTHLIETSFLLLAHIIPALFLIGMGFVEDPYVSVALMTLSLGFNGASTMTSLQNSQGKVSLISFKDRVK